MLDQEGLNALVVHGDFRRVPLAQFELNPWNPNRMGEAARKKLRESLVAFGFVAPILSVELNDGRLRILNGAHRFQEAQALGFPVAPTVVLGTEATLPEATQRQITLLDEIHGEYDLTLTRDVLREIEALRLPEEPLVLPYSDLQVNEILAADLRELDRVQYSQQMPARQPQPQDTRRRADQQQRWVEISFRMPEPAFGPIRQALDKALAAGAGEDDWQALEAICADYLAGV
jgi:ParB-like chromosome segregation protein Spo0J